jgi:short-subunit dehydrogenase
MQVALTHFKPRGRGHIINVSSMLSRIPYVPWRSAYTAAKHALNALTASLRLELQAEYPGIHVSTVLPGVVATEFGVRALGGGPDSRTLPGAQPVDEVAEVIAELIEHPRAEAYTRLGFRQQVVDYFAAEDMADAESRPPFMAVRPAAR